MNIYLIHHALINGTIYLEDVPEGQYRIDTVSGSLEIRFSGDSYWGPAFRKGEWFLSASEALFAADRERVETIKWLEGMEEKSPSRVRKLNRLKLLEFKYVGSEAN
jgi:hypothetical protein